MAIRLPPELRERIAEAAGPLRRLGGVRWVATEQIHLTLRFIGEVDADRVDAIGAAIGRRVRPLPGFSLSLTSAGAFPLVRRARVVWIGVRSTPALARVHESVERALVDSGVAPDPRPFRPHLTLGRVERGRSPVALARAIEDFAIHASFDVAEVSLMRSELGPTGTRHTEVAALDLAGPGPTDARPISR